MTEELKNCPFCGGEAKKFDWKRENQTFVIGCSNFCNMLSELSGDKAIKAWNTRAEPEQPSEYTAGLIAKAFWRRIYPYRNKHEKELPEKAPTEFIWAMQTALMLLNQEEQRKQKLNK